ncbi:hypothetical protein QZH41_015892 [Actinostola sp. cb2023]|nr:hypothetical protein QZH41_015892 [Actinostola sp. cb2023]
MYSALVKYQVEGSHSNHIVGKIKKCLQIYYKTQTVIQVDIYKTIIQFDESQFTLRTPQNHDDQCEEILGDDTLSTTYGVKFASALCQSRYFHVIGGFPGDAMHDVLEGCLQYECKELLKYLIQEQKLFRLDDLNSNIKNFDYGYYNDSNKPSPIAEGTLNSNSNTLHQKASQMWCLARYLPLLIGAKVPPTDEKWVLFLKMLDITDMIFAPVTSANQSANLSLLIEEHHEEFKNLYPNCSIIPKLHYIIHYPRTMTRLGPMVTHWCMRFEAKHRHFKQLASALGNYTNLSWTLAERHQSRQCYEMNNIHKPVECGPGKQKEAGTTQYYQLLQRKDPNIVASTVVHEPSWVTVSGTKYKVGAVIHSGFIHLLPAFSVIKTIVVVNGELDRIVFVLTSLDTIEFNEHHHSFAISKPFVDNISIYTQQEFASFLPLHIAKAVGLPGSYVIPKYDIDLLNFN